MNSKYSHPKPCQVRQMSPVEAAYVGAMVDAEGTVRIKDGYWQVNFPNTEVEYVSAVVRATGIGSVYCRDLTGRASSNPRFTPSTKLLWIWATTRKADVEELARQLSPYSTKMQKFGYKKRLMDELLAETNTCE